MEKYIKQLVLLTFSLYLVSLFWQKKLNLYIHPRYEMLTLLAGLVGIIIVIVSIYQSAKHEKGHKTNRLKLVEVLLLLPALVGFVLPARPLSSLAAEQREFDFNNASLVEKSLGIDIYGKNLGLGEIVTLLEINPDYSSFVGVELNISGFILDNRDQNQFTLARFAITCCAVDASPIGLPVEIESWKTKYQSNDWLEISGSLQIKNDEVVFVPNTVNKIDVPENPYIY